MASAVLAKRRSGSGDRSTAGRKASAQSSRLRLGLLACASHVSPSSFASHISARIAHTRLYVAIPPRRKNNSQPPLSQAQAALSIPDPALSSPPQKAQRSRGTPYHGFCEYSRYTRRQRDRALVQSARAHHKPTSARAR